METHRIPKGDINEEPMDEFVTLYHFTDDDIERIEKVIERTAASLTTPPNLAFQNREAARWQAVVELRQIVALHKKES